MLHIKKNSHENWFVSPSIKREELVFIDHQKCTFITKNICILLIQSNSVNKKSKGVRKVLVLTVIRIPIRIVQIFKTDTQADYLLLCLFVIISVNVNLINFFITLQPIQQKNGLEPGEST